MVVSNERADMIRQREQKGEVMHGCLRGWFRGMVSLRDGFR
jgi:hypothetical protein